MAIKRLGGTLCLESVAHLSLIRRRIKLYGA